MKFRSEIGRTIVSCAYRDQVMIGTMHAPTARAAADPAGIAVLLLNAGPAPRAGNSDLSVHLADRVAQTGMRAFRFDLPGLGDSTDPSWNNIDAYWSAAQRGFNDEFVVTIVNQLCEAHGLHAVVLGGLCAGAICAVRATDSLGTRISGLILLEPNFRSSADVRPAPEVGDNRLVANEVSAPSRMQRLRRTLERLSDFDELLYLMTGSSRYARAFRPLRPVLNRVIERRLGRELPDDVLMDAVSTWRRLVARGVPTLLVLGEGLGTDRYMERILRTFSPEEVATVRTASIPETNHLLATLEAKRSAGEHLVDWLSGCFPAEGASGVIGNVATPRTSTDRGAEASNAR